MCSSCCGSRWRALWRMSVKPRAISAHWIKPPTPAIPAWTEVAHTLARPISTLACRRVKRAVLESVTGLPFPERVPTLARGRRKSPLLGAHKKRRHGPQPVPAGGWAGFRVGPGVYERGTGRRMSSVRAGMPASCAAVLAACAAIVSACWVFTVAIVSSCWVVSCVVRSVAP